MLTPNYNGRKEIAKELHRGGLTPEVVNSATISRQAKQAWAGSDRAPARHMYMPSRAPAWRWQFLDGDDFAGFCDSQVTGDSHGGTAGYWATWLIGSQVCSYTWDEWVKCAEYVISISWTSTWVLLCLSNGLRPHYSRLARTAPFQRARAGAATRVGHARRPKPGAKVQAKADGYSIYGVQTYMPTQLVTAETMSKRLSFAEANKAQCWDGVMITGYKKFLFSYAGTSASFFKIKLRILWILWSRKDFIDNENDYFSGWPNRYFGKKEALPGPRVTRIQ